MNKLMVIEKNQREHNMTYIDNMLTDVGFYLSFSKLWSSANLIPKFLHVFLVKHRGFGGGSFQLGNSGDFLGPGSKLHDLQAARKNNTIRATF